LSVESSTLGQLTTTARRPCIYLWWKTPFVNFYAKLHLAAQSIPPTARPYTIYPKCGLSVCTSSACHIRAPCLLMWFGGFRCYLASTHVDLWQV